MARISLSLKTPNSEKSQVWASLSDGRGINIKLYPGVTIKSKHWSKKTKTVLSSDHHATALNKHLKSFTEKALDIYLEGISAGIQPDAAYIKEKMKPQPEEEVEKPLTFWELWDVFIASKKGIFKKHSFVKFKSLKKHVESFETFQKTKLNIDEISQEQLEDFQTYLSTVKELNTQSTSKYIGILKIFLNWCVKRRHTKNIDFRYFTPTMQPDSLKAIITPDELETIRKVDLGDKEYLKNARELFILSCLVGLRYSDYSRISQEHLKYDENGEAYLEIRQQKTEEIIELPLIEESEKIVKKLLSGEVHSISNQKMNTYVKEVCKKAKIDEPFEKTTYRGKEKTVIIVKKYDLISTHTGRRTFATNLLNRGASAELVMNFTGHRDYKSFKKYVNIPKKTEMRIVRNALIGSKMLIA